MANKPDSTRILRTCLIFSKTYLATDLSTTLVLCSPDGSKVRKLKEKDKCISSLTAQLDEARQVSADHLKMSYHKYKSLTADPLLSILY